MHITFKARRSFEQCNVKIDVRDGWLLKWKWQVSKGGYVERSLKVEGRSTKVSLAREVLGLKDTTLEADHINGDKLDNTRENLRVVTSTENKRNRRMMSTNESGCQGVYLHKCGKWAVKIQGKHVGLYETFDTAKKVAEEEYLKREFTIRST